MLKVYSITAIILVQAFVLFIGQANANNNSSCANETHPVTYSSNSSSWVLCLSSTVSQIPEETSSVSPSKSSPCTVTKTATPEKYANSTKCSVWEAADNQCEKCSDGGGGPIQIKRKCTIEKPNSCDYEINEEKASTECVTYCDGSSHSPPSVALVLLLTIATAFRYTVY